MPIRKYNPTSPGLRGKTSLTFDEITTSEPHRPLTEKLHRSGGRNNRGELTSWWRGGGHKRLYRIIDFPLSEVKRLAGIDVPLVEARRILTHLGFMVAGSGPLVKVAVPSWMIITSA